jgi:hypothetical protein
MAELCDQYKLVAGILLLQLYLKRQISDIRRNCC